MREIEVPIRVRYWRKYKSLVLIPPRRSELRKELDNTLVSGGEYYGVIKVIMFGESRQFNVGVKFYRWEWENRQGSRGLNTVFVVTESDCHFCMEDVMKYVMEYGTANGVLTLYLP